MNTTAEELITKAESLGASFTLSGDKVKVEASEPLPADFVAELRQYKPEIVAQLIFVEIERGVQVEGFALCYCRELNDCVVFHRDDVDPSSLPKDFVRYSMSELELLFGDGKPELSQSALRLIHQSKLMGMKVVDNYCEAEHDDKG